MSSNEEIVSMKLQHRSCSGMFWRGDPVTKTPPPNNDDWPRNGAILRGTGPHIVNGEKYLKVLEYQQAGTDGFVKLPDGMFMLYDQGGPILYPV